MPSRTESAENGARTQTGATPDGKVVNSEKKLSTIEPVTGNGLGVIAAQHIPRGTRILEDAPLFVVPTAVTNVQVMKQIIAAGLKNAPKEKQREFLTLPNAHPENGPLVGTASTNVHPMGGASATDAGMFLTACRINHSCDNNAQNSWSTRRKRMIVHACRDIEKGEEINLTYLTGLLSYTQRQDILKERFGFECRCERCVAPAEQRAESDKRREDINRLDERLGEGRRIVEKGEEALRDAYNKLKLLGDEGISDAGMSRTYYDAFQVAVANGDTQRPE